MDDIFEMSDAEHHQWLQEEGTNFTCFSEPSEENLCRLISEALRLIDKGNRARSFIDIANMSLALADKTLGADSVVPQCDLCEVDSRLDVSALIGDAVYE